MVRPNECESRHFDAGRAGANLLRRVSLRLALREDGTTSVRNSRASIHASSASIAARLTRPL